jgi:hypothetical protein
VGHDAHIAGATVQASRVHAPAPPCRCNNHSGSGTEPHDDVVQETWLAVIRGLDGCWNGNLTSIGASPVADQQTAPCWVEISHDGRYLFTVNTAQPSISSYVVRDGPLTLLGSTPFKNPTGLAPVDARLSRDGSFSVVDGGTAQVSTFRVQGGALTELASSPTALPAGSAPFGIVTS